MKIYLDRLGVAHEYALKYFWQISQIKRVVTLGRGRQQLLADRLINCDAAVNNAGADFEYFLVIFFKFKIQNKKFSYNKKIKKGSPIYLPTTWVWCQKLSSCFRSPSRQNSNG